ncbi:unnamed protein product [Thelazia callipaeda]|uniref:Uncharacterized protein n=1 Tax=Thelazia callipaeda TaxID=103827 RepID=A0A0N5CMC2_THECL|nr:unnamed protein product [Thelazia callipaeda]
MGSTSAYSNDYSKNPSPDYFKSSFCRVCRHNAANFSVNSAPPSYFFGVCAGCHRERSNSFDCTQSYSLPRLRITEENNKICLVPVEVPNKLKGRARNRKNSLILEPSSLYESLQDRKTTCNIRNWWPDHKWCVVLISVLSLLLIIFIATTIIFGILQYSNLDKTENCRRKLQKCANMVYNWLKCEQCEMKGYKHAGLELDLIDAVVNRLYDDNDLIPCLPDSSNSSDVENIQFYRCPLE